jgi:tetratricopeptide (TPR) repeat protein
MTPDERPVALRLAHLHLRMGSLALARAALELAWSNHSLDDQALVDLAEARWRMGNLDGAGQAAGIALEHGATDPLALVIAAETAAAAGRRADADELAATVIEGLETTLDALFAGMPRSQVWPGDPEAEAAAAVAPDTLAGDLGAASSAPAAESLAAALAALEAGSIVDAGLGFSLAMRLEPGLAEDVLAAVGDGRPEPFLALVAGDALRLLGRDEEAAASYERALARSPLAEDPEPG